MKISSFDLESAVSFPDSMSYTDEEFKDLGISCAALANIELINSKWTECTDINFLYSEMYGPMSEDDASSVVDLMLDLVSKGYKFLTWNGTSFDFRLLGIVANRINDCAYIAYEHHIDMMLYIIYTKGYHLSLQTALEGIGSPGKLHEVTLLDGTILDDMRGVLAPELWAVGEYEAVLNYLAFDVLEPLKLMEYIHKNKKLQWISKRGNFQSCQINRLYTVKQLHKHFTPPHFFFDNGHSLDAFFGWMPFFSVD